MPNIHIDRIDDAFHMVGTTEDGTSVHMDLTEAEGGTGQGVGPMQMVATALGGCSAIDIIHILKKGQQTITSFSIDVDYERAQDQTPAIFTTMHVHYTFEGDLQEAKVRRAVQLSLDKYCSVAKILEKTATITSSFSLNGERFD